SLHHGAVLGEQVGGRQAVEDGVLAGSASRVVDQHHADTAAVDDLSSLVDQRVGATGADHDVARRGGVIHRTGGTQVGLGHVHTLGGDGLGVDQRGGLQRAAVADPLNGGAITQRQGVLGATV